MSIYQTLTKREGPCFVVAHSGARQKILERFPLTEDGWVQAWAALVRLDPGAAEAVAEALEKMRAAHAEAERQAQVHEAFASAGPPTVLRSLGVQVLAKAGEVYTIGGEIRGRNTSRLLGPLAGAQAVVTDGSQAWSPGRAMFLPLSLTGLATKTKADAVVIFADGTFRTVALEGNNAVREAQKQAVQFNALAASGRASDALQDGGVAAELERLTALHKSGALDDEEFRAAKARIIHGG